MNFARIGAVRRFDRIGYGGFAARSPPAPSFSAASGTPRSELPKPTEATAPQSEPALALAKPTEAERAAQPPAPIPPSFDVVKVGPTGTAVIAGRAEPGAKVIVRDGDKAIGEVTADRRGEWVLIPDAADRSG